MACSPPSPALWFSGSLLIRTSAALGGFYWVSQGEWLRLLACLLGFLLARVLIIRKTRIPPPPTGTVGGRGRVMNLSSDQVRVMASRVRRDQRYHRHNLGFDGGDDSRRKVVTRHLKTEGTITRWQSALEIIVTSIQQQIKEVGLSRAREYLPFLGTLFLFMAVSSLCTVIPGFAPPTGSLSTTAGLRCVFFSQCLFSASRIRACWVS